MFLTNNLAFRDAELRVAEIEKEVDQLIKNYYKPINLDIALERILELKKINLILSNITDQTEKSGNENQDIFFNNLKEKIRVFTQKTSEAVNKATERFFINFSVEEWSDYFKEDVGDVSQRQIHCKIYNDQNMNIASSHIVSQRSYALRSFVRDGYFTPIKEAISSLPNPEHRLIAENFFKWELQNFKDAEGETNFSKTLQEIIDNAFGESSRRSSFSILLIDESVEKEQYTTLTSNNPIEITALKVRIFIEDKFSFGTAIRRSGYRDQEVPVEIRERTISFEISKQGQPMTLTEFILRC